MDSNVYKIFAWFALSPNQVREIDNLIMEEHKDNQQLDKGGHFYDALELSISR